MVSCLRQVPLPVLVEGLGSRQMGIVQPLRNLLSDLVQEPALVPDTSLSDYAVDGKIPRAVVFPSSEEQLASILSFANDSGFVVTPRGSGNLTALGNLADSIDIVLETTSLEPFIDYSPDDLTVTVGSGVSFENLQRRLLASRQWLPIDPPLASQQTIGGILATDLGGPLCTGQGLARDLVLGMKVVSPAGEVTKSGGRVVKNVTGFNLGKLHTGALGTLSIILEVSFKVWPLPNSDTTIAVEHSFFEDALTATKDLLASYAAPDAAEIMWSAEKEAKAVTHLRLLGTSAGVRARLEETNACLRRFHFLNMGELESKRANEVWHGLADFGWGTQARGDLLLRIGCSPSQIGALADELGRAVEQTMPKGEGRCSFLASPGRGLLRCLITGSRSSQNVKQIVEGCREAASSVGGYTVVERCPPEAKVGLDVWGAHGEAFELMKRIKVQFDPNHILNRGRYLGMI